MPMKLILKCKDCNKEFEAKTNRRNFCDECREKRQKKSQKKYYQKSHINIKEVIKK